MTLEDERIFACSQCPKIFATRSNLKRHMENPNIHNIPYVRSRDQKRWKGHAKKVVSKEETTERMRKWRAENREKNRQNDLRCRVYRLARQKFGEHDSIEKQAFVREEISRRLGRRMFTSHHEAGGGLLDSLEELPFYSAPQQKIELPSIQSFQRSDSWSSDDMLPPLSPCMRRRTSSSSISSLSSITSGSQNQEDTTVLPPMQTILNYVYNVKYVEPARILDEFVGVILNYAQDETMAT